MELSPPLDFTAFFADICGDSPEALELCWASLGFVHWLDDTVDGDKPKPTAALTAEITLRFALCLAFNPFWRQHKARLLPLLIQGVNAWVDSLAWSVRPQLHERIAADVLKSIYGEMYFHIAFILGGWQRQRFVTTKWRNYNFDAR